MGSERSALWTNILGITTAAIGLVTALIVLAATVGSNQNTPTPSPFASVVALVSESPALSGSLATLSPSPTASATSEPSAAVSAGPSSSVSASPAPSATATSAPTSPAVTASPAPATSAPASAPATPAPTRRPIVFYSVRDDPTTHKQNADLFVVDPATALEHRLTTESEPDSDPAWSPDGRRVAFDSRRAGGHRDIWVLEANGAYTRITDDDDDDAFPTWSPDGTTLAWSRGPAGSREIWTADAHDGSRATAITSGHDDIFPNWSVDGLIAFQRRSDVSEIWVIQPGESGAVVRITASQGGGMSPAWSPDGRRLAFVRSVGGVNRAYVVNADGVTSLRSVTPASACDCDHPTWSLDGSQIAFVGPKGTIRALFVISAAGGTPRRITTNGLAPFWGS